MTDTGAYVIVCQPFPAGDILSLWPVVICGTGFLIIFLGTMPSCQVSSLFSFFQKQKVCIFSFSDRRYIGWLFLVTLAYNWNCWLIPFRITFPVHTESNMIYWMMVDLTCDLCYLCDLLLFQPRVQFVKGGDIIVSKSWEDIRHRTATGSVTFLN